MKKSINIKKFIASLQKHGTIIPSDKAEAILELVYKLSELAVKIELDKIRGKKKTTTGKLDMVTIVLMVLEHLFGGS
ncbi:hypothetical protein G7074_02375 [Pedobacter sp. HDW13]|uniref:hypothetical protein n=1 Tax=unclassified Pedobacter TaxID=2628915 RepID=UPI000F59E3C0|nr:MULTISPECIES: hypothetical protein [unclassified Pedobacter]QIL38222.1 hypothetical protein G7074_02375 [Pedobacter sp. HDW13]RQO64428.1 hypothetical protein DBR40_25740 [Pedobacter sp. KBW01]